MAVQSNVLTSSLSDLYSTAGGAVTDLATITSGADVLASQMDELKNAVQDLADFANTMRAEGYYTPVGAIMPFAGVDSSVPSGWFICDGVVTHGSSALQAILSAAGFADPTKTPNLKGKVIIGVDSSSYALASSGGQTNGLQALVYSNLPAHTHSVSVTDPGHGHTISDPGHSHSINATQNSDRNGGATTASYFNKWIDSGASRSTNGAGTGITINSGGTNISVGVSGGGNGTSTGDQFSIMQPYLTLNYIIKG